MYAGDWKGMCAMCSISAELSEQVGIQLKRRDGDRWPPWSMAVFPHTSCLCTHGLIQTQLTCSCASCSCFCSNEHGCVWLCSDRWWRSFRQEWALFIFAHVSSGDLPSLLLGLARTIDMQINTLLVFYVLDTFINQKLSYCPKGFPRILVCVCASVHVCGHPAKSSTRQAPCDPHLVLQTANKNWLPVAGLCWW